ncbi:Serine/threonine protein kinase PrkC, regulator of stationary phase [hydrothermal vent metagenome]|uniref:Serine/threonine protein kinase PrkC, regulator of stationary phase n=1 Tax=hydrothermal vent metagenome TaxID=652676 RepID=A0A3B0YB98_9ZZZZ
MATLAVLMASFSFPSSRIESLMPALAGRFMPLAEPSGSVAVIAIDSATLDAYGTWPWSRERLAKVIERLQQSEPAAIGVLLPLSGTETPGAMSRMREELDTLAVPHREQAERWLQQLDTDARLAEALHKAGNVVLAIPSRRSDNVMNKARELAALRLPVAVDELSWQQVWLQKLFAAPTPDAVGVDLPLPVFLESATAGVSESYMSGRYVNSIRLAYNVSGTYLPGFELALLSVAQPDTKPVMTPDLDYYPRPSSTVPVYSLKQLMRDDRAGRQLKNKTLLLGLTAPVLAPALTGLDSRQYFPVSWSAQVLDSLLTGNAFTMPVWFYAAQRGLILLLALYLMLLPPRWHEGRAAVISALLAFMMLNTGLLMLVLKAVWLPVLMPVLFLFAMQVLLTLSCRKRAEALRLKQQTVDARVALGGNLASQGQLDLALEQYRLCLPAPETLEALYELGLEFERRRQMGRARAVYDLLEVSAAGYRDVEQRAAQLATLTERFPGSGTVALNQTLVLDSPVVALPRLGRYQLERELGRGAMGTVYLAEDPTIGRRVAIKTLPLEDCSGDAEQEQAAKRFLQEVEAVGRLTHPNIVTIHDAGREHDLAYLTMDYVAGESLEAWTDCSSLLPVWEVLEIAAQVADALDYAHANKIVHRDIKPGNILYDRDQGTVKITDFGVARILDTSRTRTGTVLGTPSYMSPEQVAGAKVSGQSDLFSLGVTLYQLLTGFLPFEGDSVAALMYRITNQKMPPLRKLRSGLPGCAGRMVGRALHKTSGKRFASGADMAIAIRKCRAQCRGGRRKTA